MTDDVASRRRRAAFRASHRGTKEMDWLMGRFADARVADMLPQALAERRPDYLLLLAWNFARPIIDRHSAFRAQGGKFIVPLPQLEVC